MMISEKTKINHMAMPQRGICAHRGANNVYPENTIAAFREAVRLGAHMIEFDVNITCDGRLVIMHDETVDRTTNGTGMVRKMTFSEIRKLDAGGWKDRCFAGERVPCLEEVLDIMPYNIWINVHIKGGYMIGEMVARTVLQYRRVHQTVLASGRSAMSGAQSVLPDIMICNMDNQGYDANYINETLYRQCAFIQICGGIASKEDMERLKNSNVHINYFFSNNKKELTELLNYGVDFVLVDKLKEMLAVADALGIEPVRPIYNK